MRDGDTAAGAHVDFSGFSFSMQAAEAAHFFRIIDLIEGLLAQIADRLAIQHIALTAGKNAAVVFHVHGSAP